MADVADLLRADAAGRFALAVVPDDLVDGPDVLDLDPDFEPAFVALDDDPDLAEAVPARLPPDLEPDFVDLDDEVDPFAEAEEDFDFDPADDADLDVLDDLVPLLFFDDEPFDLLEEPDEVGFEVDDADLDFEPDAFELPDEAFDAPDLEADDFEEPDFELEDFFVVAI